MNQWELMIPVLTLLLGVFGVLGLHIWGDPEDRDSYWRVQSFVLILALAQQGLMYRVGGTIFMTGGMVIDGLSQALSLAILSTAILVHWSRRGEQRPHSAQAQLLFLLAVLLAMLFVQTNRLMFGVISVVGLSFTALNALGAETETKTQQKIFHGSIIQTAWLLFLGALLVLFSFSTFGDLTIDEMRRTLSRPQEAGVSIPLIHFTVLLLGFWILAIPPFAGFWMHSRKNATWSLTLGISGLMLLVSVNIFLRWGLWIFTRPTMGGNALEIVSDADILTSLRVIAAAGLILIPLTANLTADFRQGLLIFIANPIAQSLFAFSFGSKNVAGFAMSLVMVVPVILGLLVITVSFLKLPEGFSLRQWVGLGRQRLATTCAILLGLAACAGLPPFFGSLLVENTLRLSYYEVIFLTANLFLGGVFVARLATLAFQRPLVDNLEVAQLSVIDYLGQGTLLLILFFVGIFWEPLYKYGAYSVRYFFGDI